MERFNTTGTKRGDSRTITTALTKYPKSIIINGNDDWCAPEYMSPNFFIRKLGFEDQILAEISLISNSDRSGCVIKKTKWNQIKKKYKEMFNRDINHLKIVNAKDTGLVMERNGKNY